MAWPTLIPGQQIYTLKYPEDKAFYDPEIILPDRLTIQLPSNWTKDRYGKYEALAWSTKTLEFGIGCVIDLSPKEGIPSKPKKAKRGDDGRNWGARGGDGEKGKDGTNGMTGVDLGFNVSISVTSQGSLFINIDGGIGGNAGDGGDGGNGKQGHCEDWGFGGPNGGDGGNGGNAGIGGSGGDTAKVMCSFPAILQHPPESFCIINDSDPVPTNPPQESNDGIIRIYGAPGRGGRGGTSGLGGKRGDHDDCGFGRTDRHEGNDGTRGRDATSGGSGNAGCFKGIPGVCRAPQVFPPKPLPMTES